MKPQTSLSPSASLNRVTILAATKPTPVLSREWSPCKCQGVSEQEPPNHKAEVAISLRSTLSSTSRFLATDSLWLAGTKMLRAPTMDPEWISTTKSGPVMTTSASRGSRVSSRRSEISSPGVVPRDGTCRLSRDGTWALDAANKNAKKENTTSDAKSSRLLGQKPASDETNAAYRPVLTVSLYSACRSGGRSLCEPGSRSAVCTTFPFETSRRRPDGNCLQRTA